MHTSVPILHQDDDLIVVAKPANLLTTPAPGRSEPSLVDLLQRQIQRRLFPVHRLDEDVTGVLVLAATPAARTALEDLFKAREISRTYLALLSHAPDPLAGRIESRLEEGRDGVVRSVLRGGKTAITEYKTLRRATHTLVECTLRTGRRNQIRAHMADLGCPIVGDRKYGFRVRGGRSYPRPLLHAERISFCHPADGTLIEVMIEADEPELRRGTGPQGDTIAVRPRDHDT